MFFVAWVSWLGDEAGGAGSAEEALEIEGLGVFELVGVRGGSSEDSVETGVEWAWKGWGWVGGGEFFREIGVGLGECGRVGETVVPHYGDPAVGVEDAVEFCYRLIEVEPVECLAYGDQVDAVVVECGGFRGGVDAAEVRVISQQVFCCLSHFAVRFDPCYLVSGLEEDTREVTCAGADVCD